MVEGINLFEVGKDITTTVLLLFIAWYLNKRNEMLVQDNQKKDLKIKDDELRLSKEYSDKRDKNDAKVEGFLREVMTSISKTNESNNSLAEQIRALVKRLDKNG